jgi:hypothetical protein
MRMVCPLKSDPPCSMAFEPDGGTWNAKEETQSGKGFSPASAS